LRRWEQLENNQIVTFDPATPDAKFCLDEADESDDNKVQIWECHDADHKDYQYQGRLLLSACTWSGGSETR
jgi:hypothetical protein